MRKISCLVFMTLLSLTAVAQNFIQVEDDENNTVFYMDDNSNISHDLSDKMIITTGGKSWEYDVSKVKDIGIGITKPGIYEITQEELGEWEAGWLLSTGYYALYKANLYDNTSYVYINELCSEDGGWLFLLDENNEVSSVTSANGVLCLKEDNGKQCLVWVETDGVIVSYEVLTEVSDNANQRLYKSRLYGAPWNVFNAFVESLNKVATWYGYYEIARSFLGGDWEKMWYGIGSSIAGAVIGSLVGPAGLIAAAGFYGLDRARENLDKYSEQVLLGKSDARIEKIERVGFKSCNVFVKISELDSRPYSKVYGVQQNVCVGLYLRENLATVNEKYHSLESDFYHIDDNGLVEIPINGLEIDKYYYIVPVLIPYKYYAYTDEISWFRSYAKYGEVRTIHLSKPAGTVKVVENVELQTAEAVCEYNDIWPEVKCGVRVKENSLFFGKEVGAFWGESENGEQRISLENLNGDTSYSCEAIVSYDEEEDYSNGYSFTTKFPDISGTWNCNDGSGASYQIIISNDYAVWTLPDMYSGGIVTKGPDGRVDFTIVKRHTETVMGTGTWDTWNFYGTVNDRNHPTAIQGNVNNALGTPTISHNYEYEFTMSR